ncbi:MAG: ABC transporter ATP-binding protein [Methanocellales archaeon]
MLLEVKNLKTYFHTHEGVLKAVDGVSFSVEKGSITCIVGESGSGKSVTALSILRLIDPPGEIIGGEILFEGRDLLKLSLEEIRGIRGRKISIIFQDPMTSLNPVLKIGEQIAEQIKAHLKLSKSEAWKRAVDLLKIVGIPNPEMSVHSYPHQFSGGMRQRVLIAIAISCSPSLLIADEPTSELDVVVQAQILKLLRDLVRENKMGLLFITHDFSIVEAIGEHVVVMYGGRVMERGRSRDILNYPLHPYTKALLECLPRMGVKNMLKTISGRASYVKSGCPFAPRCSEARDICEFETPVEFKVGARYVACNLYR